MSYERMWDPEPPTMEEILEGQIKGSGGVIVRSASDMPEVEHWAIMFFGIFRTAPTTYVAYKSKDRWLDEVKRLAASRTTFTAFAARPVSAKVTVNVDVTVDGA